MVGHLDADCFYVSAERVRHPDLVGKPVGVLGNNGACVIAKSYEMKAQGVKTGTTIWDAKVLCPEGVYVKRDFYWYEVLSRKMLGIVGSFFRTVEYYSIDEFYFRAEPHAYGQLLSATAIAIRDHIREVAGLPVTIGIARTRALAKLSGWRCVARTSPMGLPRICTSWRLNYAAGKGCNYRCSILWAHARRRLPR